MTLEADAPLDRLVVRAPTRVQLPARDVVQRERVEERVRLLVEERQRGLAVLEPEVAVLGHQRDPGVDPGAERRRLGLREALVEQLEAVVVLSQRPDDAAEVEQDLRAPLAGRERGDERLQLAPRRRARRRRSRAARRAPGCVARARRRRQAVSAAGRGPSARPRPRRRRGPRRARPRDRGPARSPRRGRSPRARGASRAPRDRRPARRAHGALCCLRAAGADS